MLENYKKLIKFMKVLNGFEKYRISHGYLSEIFQLRSLSESYDFTQKQFTYTSDKGYSYFSRLYLTKDRNRTAISSNKYKFRSDGFDHPRFNIQFYDDYLNITSPSLHKYGLELKDLLVEEVHFQYSMIDNIPSIEMLKDAQEIFDLMYANEFGYTGPVELPEIDYDKFIAYMIEQTPYADDYWDKIDV